MIVTPDGDRIERPYVIHVYSAKEWLEMLREAGFEDVEAFGAWDGVDADHARRLAPDPSRPR